MFKINDDDDNNNNNNLITSVVNVTGDSKDFM
jgi:hypothetical protein